MATVKIAYAGTTTITLTAPSASASREGTALDNTSFLYDDALCRVVFTAGTVGGNKQLIVYAYGSNDNGTTYESVVTGTDAAITLRSPESLPLACVIPTPTSSVAYKKTFSIAQLYGGILPTKWGLVIQDDGAGNTGGISALTVAYNGITYTVA
jgi:subtilisin-like proprotein convertase family protein